MGTLNLPILPTTADPVAFQSECDAALSELGSAHTAVTRDFDNATRRGLANAVAHMADKLKAIGESPKEIGIAKLEAFRRVMCTMQCHRPKPS